MQKNTITVLGCFIWLLASLFYLYEFFLRTFISSIANQITKSLHLNAEHLSLIGGAYFITYGIMQIFVGFMVDSFTTKKILTIATFICAGGVLFFAFAHNFFALFLSRLLMGLGSAFGFVCLLMLSLNWFPRKNFAFLTGLSQFIGALGPMLAGAPLIFLLAKMHDNWRMAMTYVGIAGLILAFIIWIFIKDKPAQKGQKIKFLTIHKPLYKKLPGLLKNWQIWLIIVYAAMVNSSLAMLGIVWGTTYLETLGISIREAAFISSLIWIGYAIGAPALGAISDRLKRRKSPLFCGALIGLILSILLVYSPTKNPLLFGVIFFFLGVAASGQSLAFAIISEQARPEIHATGFGITNACVMLSTTLLISLFGFLIEISQNKTTQPIAHYYLHDFRLGLLFMLVTYIIATIIAMFFINETFCKQQEVTIKLQV